MSAGRRPGGGGAPDAGRAQYGISTRTGLKWRRAAISRTLFSMARTGNSTAAFSRLTSEASISRTSDSSVIKPPSLLPVSLPSERRDSNGRIAETSRPNYFAVFRGRHAINRSPEKPGRIDWSHECPARAPRRPKYQRHRSVPSLPMATNPTLEKWTLEHGALLLSSSSSEAVRTCKRSPGGAIRKLRFHSGESPNWESFR